MSTGDKVFYCILGTVCVAIAYLVLRDVRRPPDHTVTKQMIDDAVAEYNREQEEFSLDDWWDSLASPEDLL